MAIFKKDEVFAGRYILSELIGEGGFSEVWKATDSMVDDTVIAIKIYVPEKGLDEYGIKQFQKEYAITHHLLHPHLMKVYYFDIADGSPYLIMPYYEHGSLYKYISEKGTFDENQIAFLMYQMGDALANLHDQQPAVLHQDIKPHNILIKNEEHFVLTDFGISSKTRHTLRRTTINDNSLTTAYAAPERFDEVPFTNEASDIFSLGVTMYELCTGSVPWDGNGGLSLLKGAKVPKLPTRFPRELNRMIQACMSPDLSERPSAEQLKRWGKFFLEQGYWRFHVETPKKKNTLLKVAIPAMALAIIVSLVYLFVFQIEEIPSFAGTNSSLDTSMVSNTGQSDSIQTSTPATTDDSSIFPQQTKEREEEKDSTYKDEGKIIVASRTEYSNVEKPVLVKSTKYAQPRNLEQYLNQISNSKIDLRTRKKWKEEALQLFASGSIQVLDEKNGFANRYSATALLDLLVDFPHQVKVNEVLRDQQDKITELHLKMDRQSK